MVDLKPLQFRLQIIQKFMIPFHHLQDLILITPTTKKNLKNKMIYLPWLELLHLKLVHLQVWEE